MARPVVLMLAFALAGSSLHAAEPISVRQSFRIGGGDNILCLAQTMASGAPLKDMFDRGYSIICRDATVPIGHVYALQEGSGDPLGRLTALRGERADCRSSGEEKLGAAGTVSVFECRLKDAADVAYRAYQVRRGNVLYSAEGLTGYDSALRIALETVMTDRPVKGAVEVALTGAGDAAAFARVQAGTLDRSRALAEAYRRNNAGNYAESAEFFAAVTRGELGATAQAEATVNEALQKSNLGKYEEADALLAEAAAQLGNDPLVARQLRNYRAMHLLNQGRAEDALAELDTPLPDAAKLPESSIRRLEIDQGTAARLNADAAASDQIGTGGTGLSLEEKTEILDAQVDQLRGSALRLTNKLDEAEQSLRDAEAKLIRVRGGRLSSIVWMRAQILSDFGAIAEQRGNRDEAEKLYAGSVRMLEVDYPGSAVLQSARGRLAAYLARIGKVAEAKAMFRTIVDSHVGVANSPPALARILSPYAELLLKDGNDPAATSELFRAAQVMIRPGVAQTQAVLARELSGGSDQAARLFRQSVSLTRQVERSRSELARLDALVKPSPGDLARRQTLQTSVSEYEKDQVATQARLAQFPRFRAVATDVLTLDQLRAALRPGEAYYKMTVIDDLVFALLVTPDGARAARIDAGANELDDIVNRLRRTISMVTAGEAVTYPFDVGLSYSLYGKLFGPFESQLRGIRHLIVEPDGAMLRLPPNLLVRSKASVDAYAARVAQGGDPFNFTGIDWLGRTVDVSTSVSAPSFRDVRNAPRADGPHAYLGLGDNAKPPPAFHRASARTGSIDCDLPLSAWSQPISPKELYLASKLTGAKDNSIVIGEAFTDTALRDRQDLDQYRIVHFATHGILTSTRPRCPAQPALMTSFGKGDSDGLLTFREIFDLRLNADLVVLSACDTAGAASAEATRAAGLGTGGDMALDGLVRAFVGAGGRLVVASHWPVPDDYDATERLIGGLFSAPPGTSTVGALRRSQVALMDSAATSHPYYWAAFAVVGDGQSPVRAAPGAAAVGR